MILFWTRIYCTADYYILCCPCTIVLTVYWCFEANTRVSYEVGERGGLRSVRPSS